MKCSSLNLSTSPGHTPKITALEVGIEERTSTVLSISRYDEHTQHSSGPLTRPSQYKDELCPLVSKERSLNSCRAEAA